VFAIIGDNSEEFDDNNNPIINLANVTSGANHMAKGDIADSVGTEQQSGKQLGQQSITVQLSQ
jgi:hypothetical protein